MSAADSKQDLVAVYGWLHQHGLNDSHSGNVSLRLEDGLWVTPTGACADLLRPEHLIHCKTGQAPAPGASLDAPLHAAVYQQVPEAKALLHFHPPHAIALTLDGQDFLPEDFEGSYYLERVPVLSILYERYVQESPAAVAAALTEHRAVIVRGHGAYVRGASLDQAYKWANALESSARITWLARVGEITGR
jgi:L-fuculose-phosphate aldolase